MKTVLYRTNTCHLLVAHEFTGINRHIQGLHDVKCYVVTFLSLGLMKFLLLRFGNQQDLSTLGANQVHLTQCTYCMVSCVMITAGPELFRDALMMHIASIS